MIKYLLIPEAMKTGPNVQKCNVFKMNKIKVVLMLMIAVCSISPSFAQTQPQSAESKKQAELKRLETVVGTAKVGLERAEKRAASADSLLNTAPELLKQGKDGKKQADAEISSREKEYNAKIKELDKQMKSKDKNEVAEARKERKNVDVKYRAELKELTAKQREAVKKISTGEINKERGKANQKTSRDAVKRAQATFEAAQARLDAAKGGNPSVKQNKRK